jgi:hypothetical protein
MLKTAFGGNSKTVALAVISPSTMHYEESVATLRWADRVKRVMNKAVASVKRKTTDDKRKERQAAEAKGREEAGRTRAAADAEEAEIRALLAAEIAAREETERQLYGVRFLTEIHTLRFFLFR